MARRLIHRRAALRRHATLLLLVVGVAMLHGLAMEVMAGRLGETAPAMPPRIDVAYVRVLEPTAPPAVAARAAAAPPARARAGIALQPMAAASGPVARAEKPATGQAKVQTRTKAKRTETKARKRAGADTQRRASERPSSDRDIGAEQAEANQANGADRPGSRDSAHSADRTDSAETANAANDVSGSNGATGANPVEPAAAANVARDAEPRNEAGAVNGAPPASSAPSEIASAPTFVWPASTRVSYILTGNYRGPVQGDAQVEWVHDGARYQVHLDVTVGASFAPLITRRTTSDGELTPEGLAPRRYDQETKLLFHDRHRASLRFEQDAVVLADGRRQPRMPGIQDSASQFIQLSYLFTTQPGLLQVGRSVELPLALPRKLDRWTYDVADEELLWTSFGPLSTFHVKPRREPQPGGDLVAEAWFAPELRYLPVRIRIVQDADTYIDLLIARKPELAAP
jgi:hypothetical protein